MDDKVEISISNSAWVKEDFPVKEEYRSNLEDSYRAEIDGGLDKQKINDWVEENTNGKIEKIVKEITLLDRLFLIKAVYFDGEWKKKFEESETSQQEFRAPSEIVEVSMMS